LPTARFTKAWLLLTLVIMARRITAALAIVALIWVLLLLLWTVERHRERTADADQPASVAMSHWAT
jgi:hypothetical protein